MTAEKVVRVGLLPERHTELQRNYAYFWRNTRLSQNKPNYSRSRLQRQTVAMDQEKEIQWIRNYSELHECESVLKTEEMLMDVLGM